MYLFTAYVTDRQTGTTVCIGDLLTRTEASELKRAIEKVNACEITIVSCTFYRDARDKRRQMERKGLTYDPDAFV